MSEQIIEFLKGLRSFGRRLSGPAFIREDQARGREIVRRVFKIWLEGYNAGLETPADSLLTQLSAGNISDSRGLFDGAFAGMASRYLSSSCDESAIQSMLDRYPDQSGTAGLGIGAAISHLGIKAVFTPRIVRQHAGWLCVDSYGLHEGYFHWTDAVLKAKVPAGVGPEAQRAFDQGLGRGLWAVGEANPAVIEDFVSRFDSCRLPDLWHGLGLMIGYWGAYDATDMKRFLRSSGRNRESLQLGVALATMLRLDTNDIVDHTEGACSVICQASSQVVADMVRDNLKLLSGPNIDPALFNMDRWHFIIKHTFVRS
jgi:enediyne biosynthesis protein E3